MAVGLIKPVREMSTRDISWGGRGLEGSCDWDDNFTIFMCPISWNLGASNSGTLKACQTYREIFTFTFTFTFICL